LYKKNLKKKKKYGKSEEVIFDKVIINIKFFKEYYIDYLILVILKYTKQLLEVKQVIIQMNQAGNHGSGRKNIVSTLKFLNNQAKTIYPLLTLSF
jgi:predicted RNA-binding protein with PUA domain